MGQAGVYCVAMFVSVGSGEKFTRLSFRDGKPDALHFLHHLQNSKVKASGVGQVTGAVQVCDQFVQKVVESFHVRIRVGSCVFSVWKFLLAYGHKKARHFCRASLPVLFYVNACGYVRAMPWLFSCGWIAVFPRHSMYLPCSQKLVVLRRHAPRTGNWLAWWPVVSVWS